MNSSPPMQTSASSLFGEYVVDSLKPANAPQPEPARSNSNAAPLTISYTVITGPDEDIITKSVSVDETGALQIKGGVNPWRGKVRRHTIVGAGAGDVLQQFSDHMKAATCHDVLVPSPPTPEGDEFDLVVVKASGDEPGTISHIKANFQPPQGPALCAFDLDLGDLPLFIREKLKASGDVSPLTAALVDAHPAFAQAACVIRPSASSWSIFDGKHRGERGQHRFFVANDGRRIEAFVEHVRDRLMLAGYVWALVTKDGRKILKTLFDVVASRDMSRFFFEGGLVVRSRAAAERVKYEPGRREPQVRPGGILDLTFAPLTEVELKRLEENKAKALAAVEPEAKAASEDWIEANVAKQIAKGIDPSRARTTLTTASATRRDPATGKSFHILTDTFELVIDDEFVTVGDVLSEPAFYHGKRVADPLEPDYDGGRKGVAKLFVGNDGVPRINSFAHGENLYVLKRENEAAQWFSKEAAAANDGITPSGLGEVSEDVWRASVTWSADDIKADPARLLAMQNANPKLFQERVTWWSSGVMDVISIDDLQEVLASAGAAAGKASAIDPNGEWPEPVDIFGEDAPAELSKVPDGALPDFVAKWVRSESRRKGVPQAFAAAAAVGVLSAAIGTSLRVRVQEHDSGWAEPASLWVVLVAGSGRAKSPIIAAAVEPLLNLDKQFYARDKPRHDAWLAAAQRHKKKPIEPDPGPEPKIRRIVVDDTTLERQVRIHADNPRGLLRAPDELLGFLGSFGLYKKGAEGDRTQALRLFEGRAITVDRVGAGSIRAEEALMAIVAGTQPPKLAEIVHGLGADGMLQRFLFVLHDGIEREAIDERPDVNAIGQFDRVVSALAEAEHRFPEPLQIVGEARKRLNSARKQIAQLKSIPGLPDAWHGHVEKWGKILPRLILTFHAAEQIAEFGQVDDRATVSSETVDRAVSFARFLLRHALRFYQTYFDTDPSANDAQTIAGYLLPRPELEVVSHRTIYDARKDLRQDKRRRFAAMGELENSGWCRVEERDAEGPKTWRVNPKIRVRFAERAARELAERTRRREAIIASGKAKAWIGADNLSEN